MSGEAQPTGIAPHRPPGLVGICMRADHPPTCDVAQSQQSGTNRVQVAVCKCRRRMSPNQSHRRTHRPLTLRSGATTTTLKTGRHSQSRAQDASTESGTGRNLHNAVDTRANTLNDRSLTCANGADAGPAYTRQPTKSPNGAQTTGTKQTQDPNNCKSRQPEPKHEPNCHMPT